MKRPSFQFYPAEWQKSRWVAIDGSNGPLGAPPVPACYVIYLDGVLSYIGQTIDLRKRMAAHKIDVCRYSSHTNTCWGQFDQVIVKAHFGVRYGDWAMRELRLIRRLSPPMNFVGSTRKRKAA